MKYSTKFQSDRNRKCVKALESKSAQNRTEKQKHSNHLAEQMN